MCFTPLSEIGPKRALAGARVPTWRTTGPPKDDPVATSKLGAWGRPSMQIELRSKSRGAANERRLLGSGLRVFLANVGESEGR